MKFLGLKVDGIRLLSAVEMEFDAKGGLTQIKGKNKQGKTSVLDSFELMFKGMRKRREDMITHGKEKAEIVVSLDEGYQIKRTLTSGKETIEIRKDGRIWKDMSPQAFLDTLTNDLTFNPRPFLDKKSEDKLKFLMDLLKIDFSKIDKEIQDIENERLLIGREVRAFGDIQPVEPMEEVDVNLLLEQKAVIQESNNKKLKEANDKLVLEQNEITAFNNLQRARQQDIDKTKNGIDTLKNESDRVAKEIQELEEKIKKLKSDSETLNQRIANGESHLKSLPEPEPLKELPSMTESVDLESTEDIDIQLAKASETNKLAMKYTEYLLKTSQKESKEAEYNACTAKIEAKRDEKKAILAGTKMPIEGLEIKEVEGKDNTWGVYFNGIHCENWSDSEGITISSNLCLAMKPKLSAVFIDRGECYDEDSRKALAKWAEENDIQTFITIVESIPQELEDGVFYVQEGIVVKGGE